MLYLIYQFFLCWKSKIINLEIFEYSDSTDKKLYINLYFVCYNSIKLELIYFFDNYVF